MDEFNELFDSVLNIEVFEWEDDTNVSNKSNLEITPHKRRKSYKYKPDLCAKRMGKCGTEGGLMREPLFQNKLLNHVVYYEDTDPKMSFADTDVMDGLGFTVLFGKYRKEERRLSSNSSFRNAALPGANYITHTGVLRIRFDLLSTTEKEKRLAVKFMKIFVDVMSRIERENR